MVKVKLIQKIKDKNGDIKRVVKSEKEIKKNENFNNFMTELSDTFNIPKNKVKLMALTEEEDEYAINEQDDLDLYLKETKEFMIIMEDEDENQKGDEEVEEEDYMNKINIKINFDISEKEIQKIMDSVKIPEIDDINDDIQFDIEKYKEDLNKKCKTKFEDFIKVLANDIKNIISQKINIIKANISSPNLNLQEEQKKCFEAIERETKAVMNDFNKVINNINDINKQLEKLSFHLKDGNDCHISDEEQDNNNVKKEALMIKFEMEEIKHEVSIKEANFFNIDDINICNIGNKEFKNLFFVIDDNISSKNLVFYGNSKSKLSSKLTPNGPLKNNEKLNHNPAFHFDEPKIGEYIIFIYVREKPDGENLSHPLKIIVNLTGDNTEIDYKNLDKKKVEEIFDELEEELNITSVIDKEIVIKKIIEFNCDKENLSKWYEDYLSNNNK